MKKALLLGLLYVCQALNAHADEGAKPGGEVHVLTLNVSIGDRQIMAPVVGLIEGKPALVAVDDGDEKYTLRLLVKPNQVMPQVNDAVQIESDLLAGRERPQSIFNPMMVLRRGSGGKVSTTSARGDIVIEVLSHATRPRSTS